MSFQTAVKSGEFGLKRVASERAKGYLVLAMQFGQIFMTTAIYLVTTKPSPIFLGLMLIVGSLGIYLFWRFMRFDFKVGMAAEYGKTWEINPKYQELRQELMEIRKALTRLEHPLIVVDPNKGDSDALC